MISYSICFKQHRWVLRFAIRCRIGVSMLCESASDTAVGQCDVPADRGLMPSPAPVELQPGLRLASIAWGFAFSTATSNPAAVVAGAGTSCFMIENWLPRNAQPEGCCVVASSFVFQCMTWVGLWRCRGESTAPFSAASCQAVQVDSNQLYPQVAMSVVRSLISYLRAVPPSSAF